MTDRDDLLRRVRRANPVPPHRPLSEELAHSRPPVAWLLEGKTAMAETTRPTAQHRWRGPAIAAAALVAALAIALPLLLLSDRGEPPVVTTDATTTTDASTTTTETTPNAASAGILVLVPDACEGCDELAATLTDLSRGEIAVQVLAAPEGDQRPVVQVVSADGTVLAEWRGVDATIFPADRATVENARAMILAACNLLGGCSPDTTSTTTTTIATLPPPTIAGVIAFARKVSADNSDIYVVRSDGTGLTQLTDDPGYERFPSWSPDGSMIAYQASANTEYWLDSTVWVMNADGSGKVQLTETDGGMWPVWSPDGTQIAFMRYFGGDPRDIDIFVMNADGSEQRCVIQLEGDENLGQWMADGRLLFINADGLNVVNPDGTGLATLETEPDAFVAGQGTASGLEYVSWTTYALSPDGTTIAYLDLRTHQVLAIPFGGGGTAVTLLDSATRQYFETSDSGIGYGWTPNSQGLALASGGWFGSTILIVNADGRGLSMVPGIDNAMDPAWRPEG